MRGPVVALVAVMLVVPVAWAAGSTSGTDATGDETTWVGLFVGTRACRDPMIDLQSASATSDGVNLNVTLSVLNVNGAWTCGARMPEEGFAQRVFFRKIGSTTVLATREGGRTLSETSASICYLVNTYKKCGGVGSVSGNSIHWTIPLKTTTYDVRGLILNEVFAQGYAAGRDGWSHGVLSTTDFLELDPFTL